MKNAEEGLLTFSSGCHQPSVLLVQHERDETSIKPTYLYTLIICYHLVTALYYKAYKTVTKHLQNFI